MSQPTYENREPISEKYCCFTLQPATCNKIKKAALIVLIAFTAIVMVTGILLLMAQKGYSLGLINSFVQYTPSAFIAFCIGAGGAGFIISSLVTIPCFCDPLCDEGEKEEDHPPPNLHVEKSAAPNPHLEVQETTLKTHLEVQEPSEDSEGLGKSEEIDKEKEPIRNDETPPIPIPQEKEKIKVPEFNSEFEYTEEELRNFTLEKDGLCVLEEDLRLFLEKNTWPNQYHTQIINMHAGKKGYQLKKLYALAIGTEKKRYFKDKSLFEQVVDALKQNGFHNRDTLDTAIRKDWATLKNLLPRKNDAIEKEYIIDEIAVLVIIFRKTDLTDLTYFSETYCNATTKQMINEDLNFVEPRKSKS